MLLLLAPAALAPFRQFECGRWPGGGEETEPAGPLRFEGAWCVRFAAWSELLGRWRFGTIAHHTHTTHKQLRKSLFFVRRSNYLFFSWFLEMNGLGTPGCDRVAFCVTDAAG